MRYGPFTVEELIDPAVAALGRLYPTLDGGIRRPTDDLSPAPNWAEADRDGNPVGWFASGPLVRIGDHFYLTLPGKRPAAQAATEEEKLPPLDSTRTRQTSSPNPLGAAYVVDSEVVPGTQPARNVVDLPKQLPPSAVAIARSFAGFRAQPAGAVSWAYGFEDEGRNRTPASAYAPTETALGEGQGLRCPLPEVVLGVEPARFLNVYVKLPGMAVGVEQGKVDLSSAIPPYFDVPGPFVDDGREPPQKNQTGVGRLPAPAVGSGRPGSRSRSWVHEEDGPKGFGIQPAIHRFFLQVKTPRGASLLSIPSREVTVREEKRGKVFRCYPPRDLPPDWEYTFWDLMIPLAVDEETGTGGMSWGRVGPTRFPGGAAYWFRADRVAEEAVGIWGYPGDTAPGKLEHRLYQVDPPDPNDPEADGTVIPAPDPASKPDAPHGYGIPWPTVPASYGVSSAPAVEGYPGEGPISESARVDLLDNQTAKARSRSATAGLIVNAEGSERAPGGDPLEWTFAGFTAPATRTVENGVLTVQTSTNLASGSPAGSGYFEVGMGPEFDLPAGVDSDLLVVGTVSQARSPSVGAGQLALKQIDDSGAATYAVLTDRKGQPMSVTDAGTKTLLPRGQRFGPGGTPFASGTVRAQVVLRPDPAQPQWNQILSARDVQAWDFGKAVRKASVSPPDADDPAPPADPDNVSSASPYPAFSRWMLGPAPQVPGAPVQAAPPLAVIDFAGIPAGGAPPAALGTLTNSPAPATHAPVVEDDPTSPTGTGKRLKIFDASTNQAAQRHFERTYAAAEIGPDGALATRILFRIPTSGSGLPGLPTRGVLGTLEVRDQDGKPMGLARVTSSAAGGSVTVHRLKADGSVAETRVVSSGLAPGTLGDVELAIAGGDTKNGTIRCSAGVNGPRSATQAFSGQDFSGRSPRARRVGGTRETDPAAKWALWVYSVVDTLGGDVLDRENPKPPSNYAAPDPDAPAVGSPSGPIAARNGGAGGFRLLDARGRRLNQWWGLIERGAGFGKGHGPTTRRPIVVKPGLTYTHAVRSDHLLLEASPEAELAPSQQLHVTLTGPGKEPLAVGSPFGPVGMAARQEWTPFDLAEKFVVPDGYFYAHVHPKGDCPGVYCFQEYGFFEGDLTAEAFGGSEAEAAAQAARDALRAYGALDSGDFAVVVDSALLATEFTPEPWTRQRWVALGADHGAADVSSVPVEAGSTDARPVPAVGDAGAWGGSLPPEEVPEAAAVRISGTLSQASPGGDEERPEIPPGGVFLETRPLLPVLLDADRRPILGVVIAGDADAFRDSEENEEPVNGHALSIRTSDVVDKLTGMGLRGFTGEAWRVLREATANTIFYYEDPFGGEDGAGRVYKIRFYKRLEPARSPAPLRVYGGVPRAMVVVEAAPDAEVLEVARMGPVRAPAGGASGRTP